MPHHPTFCPAFPPAALRATPHASPPALPHRPPPISPPPAALPLHRLTASLPAATRHPNPRRVVVALLCVGACARRGATHCRASRHRVCVGGSRRGRGFPPWRLRVVCAARRVAVALRKRGGTGASPHALR